VRPHIKERRKRFSDRRNHDIIIDWRDSKKKIAEVVYVKFWSKEVSFIHGACQCSVLVNEAKAKLDVHVLRVIVARYVQLASSMTRMPVSDLLYLPRKEAERQGGPSCPFRNFLFASLRMLHSQALFRPRFASFLHTSGVHRRSCSFSIAVVLASTPSIPVHITVTARCSRPINVPNIIQLAGRSTRPYSIQ
jgi:hypothetical protein